MDFVAQVPPGGRRSGWELSQSGYGSTDDRGPLLQKTLCIYIYFVYYSCLLFLGNRWPRMCLSFKRASNKDFRTLLSTHLKKRFVLYMDIVDSSVHALKNALFCTWTLWHKSLPKYAKVWNLSGGRGGYCPKLATDV